MATDIPNRGPQLMVVCITLLTIAVISIAMRCFTRLFIVKGFGKDDYLMVFAMISFTLFVTCAITGVHYGTGRHRVNLSTHDFEEAMKYWWLCYIWYCVTMISSKLSIGVFLLRITVQKIHHYILYMLMFLSVMTGLVFFFVTLFQCHPVTYFWYKEQDGTCIDSGIIAALTYLYSAISVICDFTFALLPLHIIHGLQMNKNTKLALIPILGMGCVASIAVVVRFAYIEKFKDPDFLWATLDIAIWSTTEQGLAITAGSLASLQPLLKRVAQRFGIWETRRTLPGSNDVLPRTIGSEGKSKQRKNRSAKDSYGMTTFDWEDGEDPAANGDKQTNQIMLTREVNVTTKRGSLWAVSENPGNESEEELTNKSPKGSHKGSFGEPLVLPRSFLADAHQGGKV